MVVSLLTKPQDPKTLNPDLISPGFRGLFSFWPRPVREFFEDFDIGSKFVSCVLLVSYLQYILSFADLKTINELSFD